VSARPSAELIIVPGTGEVLDDLGSYDPDVLAQAAVLLREEQSRLRKMQHAVEAELKDRLVARGGPPNRVWVTGEFELKLANESVWDAEELEGVLDDLADRGLLHRRLAEGVFKAPPPPEVSRSAANRLLDRLTGEAHAAVKRCRTWQPKGLRIARSIPLLPPTDD
jgi:hypothetical protein